MIPTDKTPEPTLLPYQGWRLSYYQEADGRWHYVVVLSPNEDLLVELMDHCQKCGVKYRVRREW